MLVVLLKTKDLCKDFGGLKAVHNFSLEVEEKKITALIGPNGAGKTTVFNLLTGFLPPTEGEIWLGEKLINGLNPYRIARMKIARTFQIIRIFPKLTVLDNVMLGCANSKGESVEVTMATRMMAELVAESMLPNCRPIADTAMIRLSREESSAPPANVSRQEWLVRRTSPATNLIP